MTCLPVSRQSESLSAADRRTSEWAIGAAGKG